MGQTCIPKRIVEKGIYRGPIARAWYVIKNREGIYDEGILKDVANKSETWKTTFSFECYAREKNFAQHITFT